jgi:hypothetical protein
MTEFIHHANNVIDQRVHNKRAIKHKGSGIGEGAPNSELKAINWIPSENNPPTYDAVTQVREGPTGINIGDTIPANADKVVAGYVVRAKTAQEVTDEQQDKDLSDLRDGGKDLALVVTELVTWLLANTAIQGSDFTPSVKTAYQRLKAIADRVK